MSEPKIELISPVTKRSVIAIPCYIEMDNGDNDVSEIKISFEQLSTETKTALSQNIQEIVDKRNDPT